MLHAESDRAFTKQLSDEQLHFQQPSGTEYKYLNGKQKGEVHPIASHEGPEGE